MEPFVTGQYQISDLDKTREIQPLEYAEKTILKRLNYLIGFLKKETPGLLPSYVVRLNNKFVSFLKRPYKISQFKIPTKLSNQFMHLKVYPELMQSSIAYYLQLLNFDYTKDWTKAKVKLTNKDYIQSFLNQRYYNAQALTEVIERNKAVELYKNYLTSYVKTLAPEIPPYESLEEFREARKPKKENPPNIGWVTVQGIIENGKFPQRKDTCIWHDAIVELPDTELKYLAACYGDFQSYNNNNKHFILTMEHTIVAGDPYCSCVLHDTRINDDLNHPSMEFFDNMWPLAEHQLRKRNENE